MAVFKAEEGVLAIGNSTFEGNVTITDTLYIGNNNFEFNTNAISVPTAANVAVDSYPGSQYKFAKYFITVRNAANTQFHAQELIVVNHGANVAVSAYGHVWSNHALADFDVVVNGGNVQLIAVPTANSVPLTVSTYRTIQA